MAVKLAPEEQVRVRTRAHPRALAVPQVRLLLVAVVTGYLQGLLARSDLHAVIVQARPWLVALVWVLAAVAVLFGTVRPMVRWATRTTVLTTQRLIQRAGWGRGRTRSVHLLSIVDVTVRQRRRQRRAGCGDLMVTHGPGASWMLVGMPEVMRFHELIWRELSELRRRIAQDHAVQVRYPRQPDHRPTVDRHGSSAAPRAAEEVSWTSRR